MSIPSAPVALVTGCSSGIGRATALLLARSGYRVFATVRSADDESSLHREARDLPLEVLRLDMRNEAAVHACVREVMDRAGRIDALVNNAGFAQLGAVEDLSATVLRRQFDVNVFGPIQLCQEVVPIMRAQGSGRIVNVSSLAGRISTPFLGAYCASKFALEAFSDSLRVETRSAGIHVVLVEPGPVITRFQEALRSSASDVHEASVFRTYYEAILSEGEPRFASTADRVAHVIAKSLASPRPRARYRVKLLDGVIARVTRVAPASAMDWGVARYYGISRKGTDRADAGRRAEASLMEARKVRGASRGRRPGGSRRP